MEALLPDVKLAEEAISIMRDAIHALAVHAGIKPPSWVADDEAAGFGVRPGFAASATLTMRSADPNDPNHIRIAFVWEGREHDDLIAPAGTAWEPLLEDLEQRLNVPATAVRAYRGATLLHEKKLSARRSGG